MATTGQIGDWSSVFGWPLIGLHTILTPDGKVLSFGTTQDGTQGGFIYDVWDPVTNTHNTLPNLTATDIFCAMQVIVPETGEILISGGDARPEGAVNEGVHDVNVFDYQTMTLTTSTTGPMNFDRWYPSAVTLANGQIVMLGGRDHHGDYVGYSEMYTPGVGWQVMPDSYILEFSLGALYPRTWVNSSGEIIAFTPGFERIYSIDPSALGKATHVGWMPPDHSFSAWMPSIMFAEDKVLLISNDGSAWVMDISGAPTFTSVTPPPGLAGLSANRDWGNLTLLADGSVLLNGGAGSPSELIDVNYTAAIWNPSSGLWSAVDAEATPRLYHSTSILLPDATVLSMGGGAPGPLTNLNGEIYKPPYLYNADGTLADRPVITQSPEQVLNAGDTFSVSVTSGEAIGSFSLVAFGSVTHSTNFPARQFTPDFTQQPDGSFLVTLPDNVNSLTPGYWMLFAIDQDGTPSVAATIQVATEGVDYVSELAPIDYGVNFETKCVAYYDAWNGRYSLTPDAADECGAVLSEDRVDLRQSFTIAFDLNFGTDDNGGNGIAFVLHNDPLAECSSIGGGVEINFANGVGIDFDTFQNAGDPAADHANFFNASNFQTKPIVGSVTQLGNLENGQWHSVEVHWDGTSTLSYTLDGVAIGSLTGNLSTFLGATNFAYFGVVGSTSSAANEQMVRFTEINAKLEDGTVANVSHTPGPEAAADSYSVTNSQAGVTVAAANGVLVNDGSAPTEQLNAHLVVGPNHGALALNADGSFTFTADAGYVGGDSFFYRVYNGAVPGEIGRVTLSVLPGAPGNLPPTGAPTATLPSGTEDTAYTVAAATLLQGFSDPNGDALAISGLTASNGSITANGNGTYTIAPTANFNGIVTLTYTVTDGQGGNRSGQTRSYTLAPVNDTPVISSNGGGATAAVSIAENTSAVATVTAVDPDVGQALTYSIIGGADLDRFKVVAATGALSFVAAPDFEAPADSNGDNVYNVTVKVTDSAGAIDTQAITVTVANVGGISPPASNAATINGTEENDILSGLGGNNTLQGFGGNDSLTGNGGDDTLNGGLGNDTLSGGVGVDRLNGGGGIDSLNGGSEGDILTGAAGSDTINTGAANDNVRDFVRFTAASDFGDSVVNFDVTGTSSQLDLVQFESTLNTAYDDGSNDNNFLFASGNGAAGAVAANVNSTNSGIEALLLFGTNGEGVTLGNLGSASAVAAAFNAEFVITAANGEDALLVVNDTNANSFALWQWIQAGGGETSAAEITLIGIFSANGTVTGGSFDFV